MRNILTLFIISMGSVTSLHAQGWLWAKTGQGASSSAGEHVVVNTNGNIYVNGTFTGDMTLGATTLTGTAQWGTGFISQYMPNGDFLNACLIRKYSNQSGLFFSSINHDTEGNIYLTGQVKGNVSIDTINYSLVDYYGFFAKFNPNLNISRIKYASDNIYSVGFDSQSNSYLLGRLTKPVSHIDTFTLYNSAPDPIVNSKMFLAKLDVDNNCLWTKQGFGGSCPANQITANANGLYTVGRIDSCIIFDNNNLCTLPHKSSQFLMKTDFSGHFEGINYQANYKIPYGSAVSVDALGNAYVFGLFDSIVVVSGQILERSQGGGREGYFAKYNAAGSLIWLKHIKCTGNVTGGITTNEQGFTYVAGSFSGFVGFGNGDTLFAQTNNDMYIARFNNNGDYIGGVVVPKAKLYGLDQDIDGNVIVIGDIFNGVTQFGNIPLTVNGTQSFFIAKLSAITTGIPQGRLTEDNRLNIYPNPNNKTFTMQLPEGLVHGNTALLGIYDNSGRTIKEETTDISGSRVSVDIGTIEKGTYTVILSSGHKKFTGRVVVQ